MRTQGAAGSPGGGVVPGEPVAQAAHSRAKRLFLPLVAWADTAAISPRAPLQRATSAASATASACVTVGRSPSPGSRTGSRP
ncbi:hypothetical protein [Nonomuraea dietziae]|uniref:hypothetical protein n=1 Tax=Nonomuraea dietziae TaxID=65515 RepID=UPI0031E44E61